ncbi:guanine nucleotide exchange factor subunit RIC1-like isoform X1 [Haliotis rufescens]|uniref:guanine nucleotide exchange factor subunit RIC1-like isoform X1 n=1 Tax=Haliotis rufescens TaxID=6454 RepID=UPI00201F7C96|nr:guanine nucleotide exchange factor subunit RIC1-like isoform X1 [Haliotis rufescens]
MYFPIGWPKYLRNSRNDSSPIEFIVSSCDRMFFAVLSDDTLTIWYSKPSIQIVSHSLSQKQLEEYGAYCRAEWKQDSSMLAVITSKCYVLFFKVEIDISVSNHNCLYVQQEGRSIPTPRHNINGILDSDSVPALKVSWVSQIHLSDNISCCLSVRDELVVSTADGYLNRVRWNGNKNDKATLHLRDIPVSTDLQQFRACPQWNWPNGTTPSPASKLTDTDGYVVHMEYSPTLGGYSMVLSSGKAVFVIPPSSRSEKTSAHGVWAQDLSNATSLAVNHRYRLIAFGCKSGEGIVYMIDEVVGALEISHKLVISSRDYPDAASIAGSVQCMKWTPDGTAIALTWKNGGFSLWSVFGALLVCTLGGDYSSPKEGIHLYPSPVKSMEWGLEGYHLWMISTLCEGGTTQEKKGEGEENGEGIYEQCHKSNLLQFQFLKSALSVNPCMANHEHVFLQGEDKLYMSTGDTISRTSSHHHHHHHHHNSPHIRNNTSCLLGNVFIGNKQWQVIPISHSYLASNWPIRYSAVDRAGQCVAVAGKTGFAHYALFNRKWKLFGNETQERDMVVSGGITWWKDFICLACYNIPGQRDEIRFYPRGTKLDNTFAQITKVPAQVLLLNTFRDILIIFCADSHVMLFSLERKNTQSNPAVTISKIQEVPLNQFIPHPLCVAGLTLTSLTSESGTQIKHTSKEAESMLLNVSGKLLMFQRDRTGPQIKDEDHKYRSVPFCPPSVVATSVENLWTTSRANLGKMQLLEAMWLGCGSHGMKVWLPLFPKNEGKAHNFMSKRIMLPFKVDIYPLAVLFEDAVILGAACDAVVYDVSSPGQEKSSLPLSLLERTSQIYLHHILRQLLRRNLGVHALNLARCCTELPYFPHVLELLLHEVLEAEATSKDPIPDPLLPRVVAFIQEFPEYLQTVVHCARKTEVALWPYLFSTVGNPKDLFEECLINDTLETAATYLIILQNLEKPMVSRQHATLLLDASLDAGKWELCRDLVRFLKAIDPNEAEMSPPIGMFSRVGSGSSYPAASLSPPISPTDAGGFNFSNVSNVGRVRTSSMVADPVRDLPKPKDKLKHTASDPLVRKGSVSGKGKMNEPTAEQVYIDMILCRHARKLLSSNQIRTLGYYSSNMDDFQLVSWLRRERVRAAKLDDFVTALRDIHQQFDWPLPILSYHQLKKSLAYSSSSLGSSLLEEDTASPLSDSDKPMTDSQDPVLLTPFCTVRPPPTESLMSQSTSDDVFLRPQHSKTEDSSVATLEVSDSSSLLGEYEVVNDTLNSDHVTPEIEHMSQEIANKGPVQSEVELRYLLQIMLEAGCLEWALIMATVLRDTLGVTRTVNTASLTDTPLDMAARMREGLSYLELWADTECMGYKAFFHSIKSQIQVLEKVVEQSQSLLDVSIPPCDSPTLDEENASPVAQSMRSDSQEAVSDTEEVVAKDEKSNDCSIS